MKRPGILHVPEGVYLAVPASDGCSSVIRRMGEGVTVVDEWGRIAYLTAEAVKAAMPLLRRVARRRK